MKKIAFTLVCILCLLCTAALADGPELIFSAMSGGNMGGGMPGGSMGGQRPGGMGGAPGNFGG